MGSFAKPLPFKTRKSFDARVEEIRAIREKFPNKVPVIVERYKKEKVLPYLDKTKFLVPGELQMHQFSSIIRNRMQITATQSLYLIVNEKTVPNMTLLLDQIYSDEKDKDGFLYMTYASQEMFGATACDCLLVGFPHMAHEDLV